MTDRQIVTDRQIIETAVTLLPLLPDLLGLRAPEVIRQIQYCLAPERVATPEAAHETLSILAAYPETREWLRYYLSAALHTRKAVLDPKAPLHGSRPVRPSFEPASPRKYGVVRIFFGTDRAASDATEPRRLFSGNRAEDDILRLGTCNVSIPAAHAKGRLEKPPWFLRSLWEDPAKHVVLLRVDLFTRADYFAMLQRGGKEALLFIHGYNVTFEDAARRTAQLAWDLKFPGTPILYSWPSRGSPAAYVADESSIEWTARHLKSFLCDLASSGQIGALHVIAHSMGTRALGKALELLALERGSASHIREVILTAPDIDSGVFRQLAVDIAKVPRRITLYASQDDLALQASKNFHRYPRAGNPADGMVIVPGIDSVDATGADTSFLGHSYFGSVRSIISDVFYALKGLPAAERSDLQTIVSSLGTYFRYSL